jgi:hypothetical protein
MEADKTDKNTVPGCERSLVLSGNIADEHSHTIVPHKTE